MSEIERLAAACKTITEVYLTRMVAKGDIAGIQKWSLRLADYSTRLAILTAPAEAELEPVERAAMAGHDHVLTEDEEWAIFLDAEDEKLKALDRPYGRDGAERGALPLGTHIAMCDELGLPILGAMFRSYVREGMSQ